MSHPDVARAQSIAPRVVMREILEPIVRQNFRNPKSDEAGPSRTSETATVSARATTPSAGSPIPARSERMTAFRVEAPRVLSPRRLPVRATPTINPQETPNRNGPRARDFFRRATTAAQNPPAAAMAIMSKTAINGIVSSQPMSHLRAVVCLGRLTDPSTDFAEPGYLSGVRNQSERQALTVRYHTPTRGSSTRNTARANPLRGAGDHEPEGAPRALRRSHLASAISAVWLW